MATYADARMHERPDPSQRGSRPPGRTPPMDIPLRIQPANAEPLPFELMPDNAPDRPKLPGHVVLKPDADDVIDALLADLFVHARNCIRVFGDFHLAIAFWPQVQPAVRRLMCDLQFREFPWTRTRVWSVDELDVPASDDRNRGELMHGLITTAADLPREQAHVFDFSQPDPTLHFDAQLKEHLGWREKGQDRLDFVLVPQLSDGRWGGVFPAADGQSLSVRVPALNGVPSHAGMSERLVHAARFVAILGLGKGAAPGVAHWTKRTWVRESGVLPMQDSAEVRWYLDYPAAAG